MVTKIELGEIAVDVVKKDIKNVHLSVYPPTGQGANLRAASHGPRHHPRVCHFQARLDQATAKEAARAGTRNRRASTWTAKAITCGESAICSR